MTMRAYVLGFAVALAGSRALAGDGTSTDQLNRINQKIVAPGENFPVVRLKDGTRLQTGTVATMLVNIGRYNKGERGAVEEDLRMAIPTLVKFGMFDLFPPGEWINEKNEGRTFVGKLAKEYLAGKDAK